MPWLHFWEPERGIHLDPPPTGFQNPIPHQSTCHDQAFRRNVRHSPQVSCSYLREVQGGKQVPDKFRDGDVSHLAYTLIQDLRVQAQGM